MEQKTSSVEGFASPEQKSSTETAEQLASAALQEAQSEVAQLSKEGESVAETIVADAGEGVDAETREELAEVQAEAQEALGELRTELGEGVVEAKMVEKSNEVQETVMTPDEVRTAMEGEDILRALAGFAYLKGKKNPAWSPLESELSLVVQERVEKELEKGIPSALAFCQALPDGAPGLEGALASIHSAVTKEAETKHPIGWGEAEDTLTIQRAEVHAALENHPDVLAAGEVINDLLSKADPALARELFVQVQKMGNRQSLLSRFQVSQFGEMSPEEATTILPALVESYKKYGHEWNLKHQIEYFPGEFEKLTPAEQREVVAVRLAQNPASVLNHLDIFSITHEQAREAVRENLGADKVLAAFSRPDVQATLGISKDELARWYLELNPSMFSRLEAAGIVGSETSKEFVDAIIEKNPTNALYGEVAAKLTSQQKSRLFDSVLEKSGEYELYRIEELETQHGFVPSPAQQERLIEAFKNGSDTIQFVLYSRIKLSEAEKSAIIDARLETNPREGFEAISLLNPAQKERFFEKGLVSYPADVVRHVRELSLTPDQQQRVFQAVFEQDRVGVSDQIRFLQDGSLSDEQRFTALKKITETQPVKLLQSLDTLVLTSDEMTTLVQRLVKDNKAVLFENIDHVDIETLQVPESEKGLLRIFERIQQSPSQEIQRVKLQIAEQLFDVPNPQETFERIEQIFTRNHLPLAGKVFKIFQLLHPPKVLDEKLTDPKLSPTLRAENHRQRLMTMYQDLMRVHIDSGNPSMKEYIATLKSIEGTMKMVEERVEERLSEAERSQFDDAMRRVAMLYEHSQLSVGRDAPEVSLDHDGAKKLYGEWKRVSR